MIMIMMRIINAENPFVCAAEAISSPSNKCQWNFERQCENVLVLPHTHIQNNWDPIPQLFPAFDASPTQLSASLCPFSLFICQNTPLIHYFWCTSILQCQQSCCCSSHCCLHMNPLHSWPFSFILFDHNYYLDLDFWPSQNESIGK